MSVDLLWRLRATAVLGWQDLQAGFPWRVDLSTHMLRVVLQTLFFTGIASTIGGAEFLAFAYTGSIAYGTLIYTISVAGKTPMNDRWNSTFYRVRTGVLPVAVTFAVRAWPLLLRVLAANAIAIIAAGLVFAQYDLMLELLRLLPLYLLLAVTSLPFGLALAALGLFGKRGNDIIFSNLGMFFLMIFAGCLVDSGRLGPLGQVGTVFPLFHGLHAIRNPEAADFWIRIGAETLVGAAWTAIAFAVYTWASIRVRRTDNDKVT